MSSALVLVDRRDGYAIITLNRPDSLNALSFGLMNVLMEAVDSLERDVSVRALILTGAGRAFCAGVDLKELSEGSAGQRPAGVMALNPIRHMARFSGPIVAAINGPAVTGGFELALSADIILASRAASFADTHARVGIVPAGGVSQLLSRVIGPYRAKELSLTGNFLSAERAYDWGLVNRVVEPEELLPAAEALIRDMLSIDDNMLRRYKTLIDGGFSLPLHAALDLEQATADAANAERDAGAVAVRVGAIIARGRDQSST